MLDGNWITIGAKVRQLRKSTGHVRVRPCIIWKRVGLRLNVHRFAVLIGPVNHIKHLCQRERLPFSAAYIGSLALTLYFALGVCA